MKSAAVHQRKEQGSAGKTGAVPLRAGVLALLILCVLFWFAGTGCSLRTMAVDGLGDALAGGGSVFSSDNDPELVEAAVPFSLKLMESLIAERPKHRGLLLAAARGFTQYAYAFVQQEADERGDQDWEEAARLRTRARLLYLRARNYGLRGIATEHEGFEQTLREDHAEALRQAKSADVPLLYWTAASWVAAISVSKSDPELIADLPAVQALLDRALALDETYGHGAIHGLLISFEPARAGAAGDPAERARKHFDRAVELSDGQLAGPFLALAEAVSIGRQDRKEFESLLERALAIDVNAKPEWRLENLVMQRRARWLLSRTDRLFSDGDSREH